MLVPLYGFVQGDTLGVVALVQDTDTIAHLTEVLQEAAGVRVARRAKVTAVANGRTLDPGRTVGASGLMALDRVDVRTAS